MPIKKCENISGTNCSKKRFYGQKAAKSYFFIVIYLGVSVTKVYSIYMFKST
jgi:hypothetical protein